MIEKIDYLKIINGERLDEKNRVYTINRINNLIKYFEEIEEYEKCQRLTDIKNTIQNHNLGYFPLSNKF